MPTITEQFKLMKLDPNLRFCMNETVYVVHEIRVEVKCEHCDAKRKTRIEYRPMRVRIDKIMIDIDHTTGRSAKFNALPMCSIRYRVIPCGRASKHKHFVIRGRVFKDEEIFLDKKEAEFSADLCNMAVELRMPLPGLHKA